MIIPQQLIDDKYISVQKHPTEDLYIYNYTQKCQYEHFWTEETMACRGLILDGKGNIKARPFKKFFNYSEHTGEDSKLPPLPLEDFEVFDKLDGSLGIMYWVNGVPALATRGSFTSDQAIRGTKILREKYSHLFRYFDPQYTHLFEIIYPENRIVVDYKGLDDIVLLAIIHTFSGEEVGSFAIRDILEGEIPVVDQFGGLTNLTIIKQLKKDNSEGFVIRFKSGVRTKIKFDEYVRLHRLVTGVNAKTIWEHLKDGTGVEEIVDRVPDEFYNWVQETVSKLRFEFNLIEDLAHKEWERVKDLSTRKDQALALRESEFKGIVFKMLDKQPYDEVIWKMVRPAAEKPYMEDIDA